MLHIGGVGGDSDGQTGAEPSLAAVCAVHVGKGCKL